MRSTMQVEPINEMTTMKRFITPVLAIAVALVSCKKEDIQVYNSDRPSLNFVKSYFTSNLQDPTIDTLNLNAVFYAGKNETEFKLPVRLSGAVEQHDRAYNVRLSSEKSYGRLFEGVHYTLATEQTFHAGGYADSTLVHVNLAKLREDKISGTLVVELVPGETFDAGLDNYQSIGLRIAGEGFTTQPNFWNRNNLNNYGGNYSPIKAEKYVELNGVPDDNWKESNNAKLYAYGKRTYEWFRDNPTYDNGVLVVFQGTIIYE